MWALRKELELLHWNSRKQKTQGSTATAANKSMTQNLGRIDRVLRFALAVWWLGPLAPQFDAGWANILIAAVGWIALVESFTSWCFLHHLFNIDNKNQ